MACLQIRKKGESVNQENISESGIFHDMPLESIAWLVYIYVLNFVFFWDSMTKVGNTSFATAAGWIMWDNRWANCWISVNGTEIESLAQGLSSNWNTQQSRQLLTEFFQARMN